MELEQSSPVDQIKCQGRKFQLPEEDWTIQHPNRREYGNNDEENITTSVNNYKIVSEMETNFMFIYMVSGLFISDVKK